MHENAVICLSLSTLDVGFNKNDLQKMAPESGFHVPPPSILTRRHSRRSEPGMEETSEFDRTPTLKVSPFTNQNFLPMGSIPPYSQTGESRDSSSKDSTKGLRTRDQPSRDRHESPELGSNWFSRLIFFWISRLLWVSRTRTNMHHRGCMLICPSLQTCRPDSGDHCNPVTFHTFIQIVVPRT